MNLPNICHVDREQRMTVAPVTNVHEPQTLGNKITTAKSQIVDFKQDFPQFNRCFKKNIPSFGF